MSTDILFPVVHADVSYCKRVREREAWLWALEAGADVVLRLSSYNPGEIRKVTRTTRTQIIVGAYRFWRRNGDEVGAQRWSLTSIIMPTADVLAEIGYAFAIYPSLTSLIAASAIEEALIRLRDKGDGEPADMPMFDFKSFCSLIGFEEVWAFEKKWAQ